MPTHIPGDEAPASRWYAMLPPVAQLLGWLRSFVPVDEQEYRWQLWSHVLDGLHAQRKLNQLATPANVELGAALVAAIQHEVHAGLLSDGDQFLLITKLRNLTSQKAVQHRRDELARERGNRERRIFSDGEAALVKVELDRLIAERSRPGVKLKLEPLYREIVARLLRRELIAGRSIDVDTRTIRRIHQGKY